MDVCDNPPWREIFRRPLKLTNSYSSAELALGVICSSLLTMPQFYRHIGPKITSKLSFSRKTNRSRSGNGPVPRNPNRPITQWHDLFGPNTAINTCTENYLELNENVDWQSPKTTIQGGKNAQSADTTGNYSRSCDFSEDSALEAGIEKTVRVEQFPNSLKQWLFIHFSHRTIQWSMVFWKGRRQAEK